MTDDTTSAPHADEPPAEPGNPEKEPAAQPGKDTPPPLPPTGWDPYSPPAGWDPYSPPPGGRAPAGWDPYSPPPRGWDPYSPPPGTRAPAGWDPYSPPAGRDPYSPPPGGRAPAGWDPYSPPPRGWDPYSPPPAGWDPYSPPPVAQRAQRSAAGNGAAGGAWVTGRLITALWSSSDSPGVWAAVAGIGWKRLSPGSDAGESHLTPLAMLARNYRLPVSYHEDARGQIDQLVV